jgi:hypothetical protein
MNPKPYPTWSPVKTGHCACNKTFFNKSPKILTTPLYLDAILKKIQRTNEILFNDSSTMIELKL